MSDPFSSVAGPASAKRNGVGARGLQAFRRNSKVLLLRLTVAFSFIAFWYFASGTLIDPFLVSSPERVFQRFMEWLLDGTLWFHASRSMRSAAMGFLIGGSFAVVIGYLVGVSKLWASVIEPFVSAGWATPRIALVPILIIWVGIGASLATTIAAILVFFLLFYNTYYGIREVDESLIESVRIMGGTSWDLAWRVRVPSAVIWIVAGAKVSIPQAFVGVVTAEILASNRGLGFLVASRAGQFDTTGAFAVLFALVLIGFTLDRLVTALSQRALRWK
jgi:NitT/TauT family transport system permease protein